MATQFVLVDWRGAGGGGGGGGMYCWPTNLKSGIRPSGWPHAYVIEYQVIGPGMRSATIPPELLWLDITRYVPPLGQLSEAEAKHLAGSDVHFTFLIDVPSGALNSLTFVVAQPASVAVVIIAKSVFICICSGGGATAFRF